MDHIHYNAQMNKHIREYCAWMMFPSKLKTAMERLNLSARAYDRILKVARTIADLDAVSVVVSSHRQFNMKFGS
jgi:magnesium chelatase family protein